MHLFGAAVGMSLALLAAGCSTAPSAPRTDGDKAGPARQTSPVYINIVPEAGGVRVRYALPGLASLFAFRDNANDIRTDNWSTPTPGASLARNHIALGEGLRVFDIEIRPDTQQRDRIYPSLSRIGEGWLIYAPHLLPSEESGQPFKVSYSLPDGWVLLGPTDPDGAIAVNGWVFAGPAALVERGRTHVAKAPSTPAWLGQEVIDAASQAAAFFERRLDTPLQTAPAIIIGVYEEDSANTVRGDVTPGAMMSIRFFGRAWMRPDTASARQVREILAHEIFHFWNGGIATSADDALRPWLHEGGASYAAMLALDQPVHPQDPAFLARLNENLSQCQLALGPGDTLRTAKNLASGSAPYACGVVLQWAWDAGLRFTSDNRRDVLFLWRDMIADAGRNGGAYSLETAVRLAPKEAAASASILLDRASADRWEAFADAMTRYGAQFVRERDAGADASTAVMHVLAQHCIGQRGLTAAATYIVFNTGDRCGPLSGDKEFDAVAGLNVVTEAGLINDRVRDICAASGAVTFSRRGRLTASAECSLPLPPANTFLRVTSAFSG